MIRTQPYALLTVVRDTLAGLSSKCLDNEKEREEIAAEVVKSVSIFFAYKLRDDTRGG